MEIYHISSWGSICNANVTLADGLVICRQLGFPDVVKAFHTATFGQTKYIRTWLTNINCTGNETKVTQCTSAYGWGNPVLCDEHDQISVQCKGM